MDINELNKMSVTALFGKLASQFNFGSGKDFAGMLAGAADLLSGNTDAVSREKPVENKASKLRPADLSANKFQDAPSADKAKLKKTEKLNEGKPVLNKKSPDVSKEDSDNLKNKDVAAENAVDVMQPAVLAANVLTPEAEAIGVVSFEDAVIADGIMADDAVIEGAGAAGWEAEALPGSSLILSAANEEVGGFAPVLAALQSAPVEQKEEARFADETIAEDVGVMDIAESSVSDKPMERAIPVDVFEKNISVVERAIPDKSAKTGVPNEDAGVAHDSGFAKAEFAEGEGSASEKAVSVPTGDEADVESKLAVGIKNAGHQIVAARDSVGKDGVEKVSADNRAEVQAVRLEEMLGGERLKVSVDVKGEKIACHANQSLIKDRLSLEEAVAELDNAESNVAVENMDGNSPAPAQIKVSAGAPQPIAAPQQPALADNAGAKDVVKVSGIGSVGGNAEHVAAAGEYANVARNEASAKNNETSFRDVFKGLSKEAVEQVKVNITKSAIKGIDSINVRLKPEELGHIEIKMQIKGGKLQAQIISSRPETMEALQREAHVLEKAFNEAGFQTDENSLNFSCRNDGQQAGQNQGRENLLRDFIGEVFETEANGELSDAEAANQNWGVEKGLNIKV